MRVYVNLLYRLSPRWLWCALAIATRYDALSPVVPAPKIYTIKSGPRVLESERLCSGSSRACPGAGSCAAFAGRSRRGAAQQAAIMYQCGVRAHWFLRHSAVFLNVCLWASCLALSRLVWRGHVLYGRRLRHLQISVRAPMPSSCHAADSRRDLL